MSNAMSQLSKPPSCLNGRTTYISMTICFTMALPPPNGRCSSQAEAACARKKPISDSSACRWKPGTVVKIGTFEMHHFLTHHQAVTTGLASSTTHHTADGNY